MSNVAEQRLTHLEEKLAHQERLLETLNEVIIEQRAELDALRRRLETSERMLTRLGEDASNERPPHY